MSVLRTAAVASIALALGCQPAPRPAPPAPAAALRSASAALAVLVRRETETRTLTAMFSILVQRADGSGESSRGAVVVARPDRLRLQIFQFGVMTAYDYTVNGDRYRVRQPLAGEQRIGRFGEPGRGESEAMGEDLRPLFLADGSLAGAEVSETAESFVVSLGAADARREIEILKRDGRIVREAAYAGEAPKLVVEYGDYRDVAGLAMPFAIAVSYPARSITLRIAVTRYTRNEPVDPKLFEL